MEKHIANVGNAAAVLGVLLVIVTSVIRLLGVFWLGAPEGAKGYGMETSTLFEVGVALMVLACLAKIHLLAT